MNESTLVIINLLGGIALLLWGVRMVRTGVLRAWGDRLKLFIETHLGSRLSAFFIGITATAVLGSGTAMAVIMAGLAASGAIGGALGLAVLLGADLGSALVSAVFASGSSFALWASPILIFVGYVTFSVSREFRPHNIGRIMIGLGMMLMALKLVSSATIPLREATIFHDVLNAVGKEALLSFIVGAALAWGFHSTLAVILLIASFLSNGSLELGGALGLILGLNFGGSLPAVSATLALPIAGRRLPMANLICRGLAAVLSLIFLTRITTLVQLVPLDAVTTALGFHAVFNLVVGIIFLPFTSLVEKLTQWLMPDIQNGELQVSTPKYLDLKSLSTPSVALSHATTETVRMSEILNRMLDVALMALQQNSTETLKLLKALNERLNNFQSAIQSYLVDLSQLQLPGPEARRALEITLYVSNLERAGDIIQLNLAERIKTKTKENITFTLDEQTAFDDLCLIVRENIKLATAVLSSGDVEGAKRLIAQKDAFRKLENSVLDSHFSSSTKIQRTALRRSAIFVDMVRDLHRINSHVVSAGYPIVDAAGLLRGSRLRKEAKIEI